jgi:predicted nuclease of predicted toxin-antitoxin system
MKLLFDAQLSPRLVSALADTFPGSANVAALGLERADDHLVFEHAARTGMTIVSKDADFVEIVLAKGPPPKLLWLRTANQATATLIMSLRLQAPAIHAFVEQPDMAVMMLGNGGVGD